MAQKGIREYDAKRLIAGALAKRGYEGVPSPRLVLVTPETDLGGLPAEHPWLAETRLVCKPDQLFGKRGKNDLLFVDKTFDEVKAWIAVRMNQSVAIEGASGKTTGVLTHFLIEPFVPHDAEYYLAYTAGHEADLSLIHI